MFAEQAFGKKVVHAAIEVGLVVAVGMALARNDQHVEALVSLDQSIDKPHGVGRVHVVVHVAVDEQNSAFEVLGQFGIRRHPDLELGQGRRLLLFFFLFLDSVFLDFVLLDVGLLGLL